MSDKEYTCSDCKESFDQETYTEYECDDCGASLCEGCALEREGVCLSCTKE